MSTYLYLKDFDIIAEIYKRQQDAELFREKEFRAALRIQAWWRGVRLRKYLRFLHKSSTIIQAAYRGHLARLRFSKIVDEQVNKMKKKYYDRMATKIQTRWRGYYTRKYKQNFKARKQYLESVLQRNGEVREALTNYVEMQRDETEVTTRINEEEEKMLQARRFHYLRSTYQINGVFASPWHQHNEFEDRLRSVKPLSRAEREKLFPQKKSHVVEDENKELPPLKNAPTTLKRQQGPFRSPKAVWAQRYRPLSPSLRVSTAYDSDLHQKIKEANDEWVNRIQNEPMRASGKIRKPYEKLLHTQSPYGQIPYGSKYFRDSSTTETGSNKNQKNKTDFKSVVPPIPIFDKFGKTFSKGTVC